MRSSGYDRFREIGERFGQARLVLVTRILLLARKLPLGGSFKALDLKDEGTEQRDEARWVE